MRVLNAQQRLDVERGAILDQMKAILAKADAESRDLSGSEERAWRRCHYSMRTAAGPVAIGDENKHEFIRAWDQYLSEIVSPIEPRLADANTGNFRYEPNAPVFEDSRGNLVKALGRNESF